MEEGHGRSRNGSKREVMDTCLLECCLHWVTLRVTEGEDLTIEELDSSPQLTYIYLINWTWLQTPNKLYVGMLLDTSRALHSKPNKPKTVCYFKLHTHIALLGWETCRSQDFSLTAKGTHILPLTLYKHVSSPVSDCLPFIILCCQFM